MSYQTYILDAVGRTAFFFSIKDGNNNTQKVRFINAVLFGRVWPLPVTLRAIPTDLYQHFHITLIFTFKVTTSDYLNPRKNLLF